MEIETSLDADLETISLDEKKMIQVLLNLSMNAIHAMPYGGKLRLESRVEDDKAVILVADTGKGISEQDLEKIYEPFFTKKDGGLGFGLSIVQRVIEDHSGRISCESKVDEGTTFRIELPLAA